MTPSANSVYDLAEVCITLSANDFVHISSLLDMNQHVCLHSVMVDLSDVLSLPQCLLSDMYIRNISSRRNGKRRLPGTAARSCSLDNVNNELRMKVLLASNNLSNRKE